MGVKLSAPMFYPEPPFVGAVVGPALLLPLPPLDQAGSVVSGQADVAAAGCGTDASPDASGEEGLGAERQLHPARQRHQERAVSADSVRTLSVVLQREVGGVSLFVGYTRTQQQYRRNHTCTGSCRYAATGGGCVKKTSVSQKATLRQINESGCERNECKSGSLNVCFVCQVLYGGCFKRCSLQH